MNASALWYMVLKRFTKASPRNIVVIGIVYCIMIEAYIIEQKTPSLSYILLIKTQSI